MPNISADLDSTAAQTWQLEQEQQQQLDAIRRQQAEQAEQAERERQLAEQRALETDAIEPNVERHGADVEPRAHLVLQDPHPQNNPAIEAYFASGGETLADVARSHHLSLDALGHLNPQITDSTRPLNPGQGVVISSSVARPQTTQSTSTYTFVNGGPGPNLDRAFVTAQVEAAFAKRGGPPPSQQDIDYWVNKALTPDVYSDHKTRVGWNPYWEARLISGGPAADPRLAGDEGVLVTWRYVNGGPGPNLDRAYITQQVEAAFAQRGGPPPSQQDIDYWVNKAMTPDVYSDGKTRVGWNKYWETRLITGGASADPRLAGDEGVVIDTSPHSHRGGRHSSTDRHSSGHGGYHFANGPGPNLDRGFIRDQVLAAFALRGGPPPTSEDVDYWVDKASKPDTYSDGKVRIGWNKYWETRLVTGGASADPRLAGNEGVLVR